MTPHVRGALAVTAVLLLSGCISLLPKERPAQLFRFGADPSAPAPPPSPAANLFTVRAAPISFQRASASDRILTTHGNEVAYVAGARWVGAASGLFEAAIARAFEVHGGAARLLSNGDPIPGDYVLKIDVRSFEARYPTTGSVPQIVVSVNAALADRKDPQGFNSRLFQASVPAGSNTVHAIAAAYDDAVRKVLSEMVVWVEARGKT